MSCLWQQMRMAFFGWSDLGTWSWMLSLPLGVVEPGFELQNSSVCYASCFPFGSPPDDVVFRLPFLVISFLFLHWANKGMLPLFCSREKYLRASEMYLCSCICCSVCPASCVQVTARTAWLICWLPWHCSFGPCKIILHFVPILLPADQTMMNGQDALAFGSGGNVEIWLLFTPF